MSVAELEYLTEIFIKSGCLTQIYQQRKTYSGGISWSCIFLKAGHNIAHSARFEPFSGIFVLHAARIIGFRRKSALMTNKIHFLGKLASFSIFPPENAQNA